MEKVKKLTKELCIMLIGCALLGVGFSLFLAPNSLNAGGISGLSMVIVHVLGVGSVGLFVLLLNIPLFAIGRLRIGRRFFLRSLIGMSAGAFFIDLFSTVPTPELEPLLAAVYGGGICGLGLGLVFTTGATTGGTDIIVRLLRMRWRNTPIGTIGIALDAVVAALTGIVFHDATKALYSGVSVFLTGKVIDAVVYRFDYSKVAWIVTGKYSEITAQIASRLGRGATLLDGEGAFMSRQTKVVLTAVRRQQLAQLKQLVSEIDAGAFIIVQEAHQVLGDGFSRYAGT